MLSSVMMMMVTIWYHQYWRRWRWQHNETKCQLRYTIVDLCKFLPSVYLSYRMHFFFWVQVINECTIIVIEKTINDRVQYPTRCNYPNPTHNFFFFFFFYYSQFLTFFYSIIETDNYFFSILNLSYW